MSDTFGVGKPQDFRNYTDTHEVAWVGIGENHEIYDYCNKSDILKRTETEPWKHTGWDGYNVDTMARFGGKELIDEPRLDNVGLGLGGSEVQGDWRMETA